jgi:hypothetical protein
MRRRTIFLLVAISLLILGGIGTGVALLVRHEPGFYRRCAMEPGPERKRLCNVFANHVLNLFNNIMSGPSGTKSDLWYVDYTEAEVNAYFREKFAADWPSLERRGVSDPRIVFEPDRIRLGFRYGTEPWDTVISLDMQVWLAPNETNVVLVEFLGRHAGSLPISARSLLDNIAEQIRVNNVDVTWYRHNGNPVAMIRFQSDKPRPTFQLRGIALEKGRIVIRGLSLEPGQIAQAP